MCFQASVWRACYPHDGPLVSTVIISPLYGSRSSGAASSIHWDSGPWSLASEPSLRSFRLVGQVTTVCLFACCLVAHFTAYRGNPDPSCTVLTSCRSSRSVSMQICLSSMQHCARCLEREENPSMNPPKRSPRPRLHH